MFENTSSQFTLPFSDADLAQGQHWTKTQAPTDFLGRYHGKLWGGIHPGEDWDASTGHTDAGRLVHAIGEGFVHALTADGFVVRYPIAEGGSLFLKYLHADLLVQVGDPVSRGMEVGRLASLDENGNGQVDSTELLTHLHVEAYSEWTAQGDYAHANGMGYYSNVPGEQRSESPEQGGWDRGAAYRNMEADGILTRGEGKDMRPYGATEFIQEHEAPSDARIAGNTREDAFNLGGISPGSHEERHDWVGPDDHVDWYKIVVLVKSIVNFVFTLPHGGDINTKLEAADGHQIDHSVDHGSDNLTGLLDPGDYYVKVHAEHGAAYSMDTDAII